MGFLVAKNVSMFFPSGSGGFFALRKCSLSFPSTGLVAIKGKSGSGKSTLLNVLSGIDRPTSGKVFFLGQDQSKKQPMLEHQASMVFQRYNLVEGETVLYNVTLPARMRGASVKGAKELLARFGLSRLAKKDVANLSGGEKQRVAICRALITNPKVIFADEPTGALDESNSISVMEAFKEISRQRLVILVSHNEELIRRYADEVVEIVDGRVLNPIRKIESTKGQARTKNSASWIGRFTLRNIRRNLLKDSVCLLSGIVGFVALLLSVGFFQGNGPAFEREQTRSLLFPYASISRKTVIEVPGSSLTLIQKTRPDLELARTVLGEIDASVENDYGYFFPSTMTFAHDGVKQEPVAFWPVYDLSLDSFGAELLCQGEYPVGEELNECLVNREFLQKYPMVKVGDALQVSARSTVTYKQKQNEFFIDENLTIIGVLDEFAFLNGAKVYYSYPALEKRLSRMEVEGDQGETITVQDLVSSCPEDSPYANYDRLLFTHGLEATKSLYSLIENGTDEFEIESPGYMLRKSYSGLSDAFVASLTLFVGIAIVGLALILGMASFSSFVAGKKESAVLITLGARRRDIFAIYVFESVILCVASAVISMLAIPVFEPILNGYLQGKLGISGLICTPLSRFFNVPFLLVLIVGLSSALLGFLSSLIPMLANRRLPLREELRDE